MKQMVVIVAALVLFFCAPAEAFAQSAGLSPQVLLTDNSLRPGDFIRLSVWPETQFGGEFTVEQSGEVFLPFLGPVRAIGVPMDELRAEIRNRFGQYFQEAVVTVTPAYSVGVLGEVQRPGLYVITPTTTLFDVIGMAGGFRPTANEDRVRVVREGEVVPVNARQALRSGSGLDPLVLRSGDQIIVEGGRLGWTRMRDVLSLFRTVALVITLVERFN